MVRKSPCARNVSHESALLLQVDGLPDEWELHESRSQPGKKYYFNT